MLRAVVLLCLSVISFSGCAKLQHMQEALTLKAYSEEKDAQAIIVEAHDRRFDQLAELVRQGSIPKEYRQRKNFVAAFGDPVLTEETFQDGQTYERAMYRYMTRYFNVPKIYVFFDEQGNLAQITHTGLMPEETASGQ